MSATIQEQRETSEVIPTVCGVCGGRMEWRAPFAVCAECGLAIPPRPVMTESTTRPTPAAALNAGGR